MIHTETIEEREEHPLDTIERLAALNDWSFERGEDDELSLSVAGVWSEYHVSFTWMDDVEALHLACAFDLKAPQRRKNELLCLISLVNEQLWMGHFDLWTRENVVMYRHTLPLTGGAEPNAAQCAILLKSAIDACDRYYQAFQFVLWAGKSPREALDGALFETEGEA